MGQPRNINIDAGIGKPPSGSDSIPDGNKGNTLWFVGENNSPAEEKGGEDSGSAGDSHGNSVWATTACSAEPVDEVEFSGGLEVN